MNTLPLSLYDIPALALGEDNWQQFVDNYETIYDKEEIDGFVKSPTKLDYTWSQLIDSLNATTLPTYVDPESPGFEEPLNTMEGASGNIPTMKKFYRLNRVTVRQQLILLQKYGNLAFTPEMRMVFLKLLDEGTDGLIQGYFNALTNQRHQVVSTGKFTIDATNNPRGLKGITIQFNIPSGNFDVLSGTARWWTNATHTTEGSASDPMGYMSDRVKYIRRTKHFLGRLKLEISKDLLDDTLNHSKVLSVLGARMYPTVDVTTRTELAKYADRDFKVEELRKAIGADSIVERDSLAYVAKPGTDADGVPDLIMDTVENFDPKNISFVPEGVIGDIQGVEPITLGYEPEKVASFDGGRLKLTQRAEAATHSIYIESEAAQLCVPNQPQWMFISTVTA